MMKRRLSLGAVLLLSVLLGAVGASAQDEADSHPGFFPLDDLGLVDPDLANVDVNLRGAMLRLVGTAMLQEEPELSDLVGTLAGIRVLVTEADSLDIDEVTAAIGRATSRLDDLGWQRIVRVRDDDEQVHVYLRELEGQIEGMTVIVYEPGSELTLVNLAGSVDFEQLAGIGRAFDIPSLESALEAEPEREGDRR